MIALRYALAAETLIRDAESNNISIINLIEEIAIPRYPAAFARIALLFVHERDLTDPAVLEGVVASVHLDKEEIARAELKMDFQGQMRTRTMLSFNGLPVSRPGVLSFSLTRNGKSLGNVQIRAVVRTEEEMLALQRQVRSAGFAGR